MANATYNRYSLEYKCPIDRQYHRVAVNGDIKRYSGIRNARAGAYRFLREHSTIDVVAIFGGRRLNPTAGVVKRELGKIVWYDYYNHGRKHILNSNGTVVY